MNLVICDSALEAGSLGRELLTRYPKQKVGSFATRTQDFLFATRFQQTSLRFDRILITPSVDQEDVNFRRALRDHFIGQLIPGSNEIWTLRPDNILDQLMSFVEDDSGKPGYQVRW